MNLCVQGLWHLGTVTAVCLASLGHRVTGFDADLHTVEGLNKGRLPVAEPGLDSLLRQSLDADRVRFSADARSAMEDIEVLWVAYDTPVDDDDIADVEFVVMQVQAQMANLPAGATVLVSSQLPVGSVGRLETFAERHFPEKGFGFASSPENLRLGKALDVFLKPDRIIVGVRGERDRERLGRLLTTITDRIEWMSVESAEMTKHAINAFLATSVTFANEIAAVCELVGADAKEVERGLKSESRIGPKAYLSPGGAFAGGTLARDIAFLAQIGMKQALKTPLLSAVRPSNDEHRLWVRRKLQAGIPDLASSRIAIWGLTYKPGTDTLRRSMAVELCNWLLLQGGKVYVHDPAVQSLPEEWSSRVVRCEAPLDTLRGAQALVISTEWPEYRAIDPAAIAATAPGLVVIDANRFLSALREIDGIKYVAVGTPNLKI